VDLTGAWLEADAPSFAARAGDTGLCLEVDAGCVLHVRIEGWSDRNIVTQPWFVEDGPGGKLHRGSHRGERVTFPGLPPGRVGTVVVGPFQDGFVVFQAGVRSDAGSIGARLFRGANASGRVVVPAACGPGRIMVTADVPGGSATVAADIHGRWLIRGLPPGTWNVHAAAERGERTFTGEARLEPGVETVLELR
jgi:hypothetical protein